MYITAIMRILSTIWLRLIFLLRIWEQDFNGVSAHVIDGKVYYIDYGMMTGSVYYNKEMWKEAGLTDDDIPKTWDEMIEVAKKLTIKDGDNIVQAGLNFNNDFHQNYLLGLNYQLGENLFKEDGKTPMSIRMP